MNRIAKRLRAARGTIPREEVAKAVGVSISAMSMYENSDRIPRDEIKIRLAKYYNTTVESFFDSNSTAGEPYEIKDLTFYNDDEDKSCQGHLDACWYEYKLTVLDRFGNPDEAFPTLPEIKSRKQLREGAIAAVAFLYGELAPALIGEVEP